MSHAILGGLAALAVSFACGMATNGYIRDAEGNAELLKAQQAAVKVKEAWNQDIARQKQEQANETRRLIADRDAALERMRKRSSRLPEPARQACEGATGAQLSEPDGSFLVRESARADELREALRQCYAWIDTVKGSSSE